MSRADSIQQNRFGVQRPRQRCPLGWACAGIVALCAPVAEGMPRVRIESQASFEGVSSRWQQEPEGLTIRATLVDDTGRALSGQRVSMRAAKSSGSRRSMIRASSCTSDGPAPRTDAEGRVCLRVPGSKGRQDLELVFRGAGYQRKATVSVPAPARAPATLSFRAPTVELNRDQEEQAVEVEVGRIRLPLDGARPEASLTLRVSGQERLLDRRPLPPEPGPLRFRVPSSRMGLPNVGRLIAQVDETATASTERAEAVALVVAHVQLERVSLRRSKSQWFLDLSVDSTAGAVPGGRVRATLGSVPVATATVDSGRAQLVWESEQKPLLTPSEPETEVLVEYQSEDPWWQPGPLLRIRLAPSEVPLRWPWLLILAPMAYVCWKSLERPAPDPSAHKRAGRAAKPALPSPRPALTIEPGPAEAGWRGTVVDAHDSRPIASARVFIVTAGLESRATTDRKGAFQLEPVGTEDAAGARLVVEAPEHITLNQPAPAGGLLNIALTSRRRKLLAQLVDWARDAGPPWSPGPMEPTPADVVRAAREAGSDSTARWAEAVEQAAFGPEPVDEDAVRRILKAGPAPVKPAAPSASPRNR